MQFPYFACGLLGGLFYSVCMAFWWAWGHVAVGRGDVLFALRFEHWLRVACGRLRGVWGWLFASVGGVFISVGGLDTGVSFYFLISLGPQF